MNQNPKTSAANDLLELLRRIRMDATAIQAKVSDAMQQLAALDLPDQIAYRCVRCDLKFKGERSLAEHLYNSHDGPLPAHLIYGESLAAFEVIPADHASPADGDSAP